MTCRNRGVLPKKGGGAWTVCQLKRGLGKNEEGGVFFFGGGGVDTPMHNMT